MIKYLALLLLTFNANAIEKDKKLHATVSFLASSFVTGVSKNRFIGFSSCLALGTVKELMDEEAYGGFDMADMKYNALGCGVGTFLTYELLKDTPFKFDSYQTENDTVIQLQYKVEF